MPLSTTGQVKNHLIFDSGHRFFILGFIILLGLLCPGCCTHYTNLDQYKQCLRKYHDTRYETDIQSCINGAEKYLHERTARGGTNLALVLDIDETALSNWEEMGGKSKWSMDFGYNDAFFNDWVRQGQCTAIPPVLALYKDAEQAGVKVYFITGRSESLRSATEKNLRQVGYDHWDGLDLKPVGSKASVIEYKSARRKEITENDHCTIILNVGDQYSDLKGGYSEKCIKLPNPFYYIK